MSNNNNNNKILRCEELGYSSCEMVPKFDVTPFKISLSVAQSLKSRYKDEDVITTADNCQYVMYRTSSAKYECARCGRRVFVGYREEPASVNVTFETMLAEKQFKEKQEQEAAEFIAQQEQEVSTLLAQQGLALQGFKDSQTLAYKEFIDSLYGEQKPKTKRRSQGTVKY